MVPAFGVILFGVTMLLVFITPGRVGSELCNFVI